MTTSRYDMMYGRQGGRIVPFAAEAHDRESSTCDGCGKPLTNAEERYHRACAPAAHGAVDAAPSLFDQEAQP